MILDKTDLRKNELVRGSFILVVMIGLFNFMNLIFHFVSGRLLGDAFYGTLTAIMAIVYIFNVPSETIQTILSKYSTKIIGKNGKLKALMIKGLKRFFYLGIASFIIFALLSPFIAKFLSISLYLIILTGLTLIIIFVLSVNRGIMQGTKKFLPLGLNFFSEGILKLSLVILFILIGLRVYGAVLGIIIGACLAFILSLITLRNIIKAKTDKKIETKGIYSYSIPVLVSIAAVTIFYSIDLLLAKGFFPDIDSQYAVISILGKVIFFGTMPIAKAMFPIISERKNKRSSRDLLKKALFFVLILSAAALIVYYFFPKIIITILYGKQFLSLSSYLLYPAIAMTLLSFSNIFIYYNLSNHKKNFNYLLIVFVALQIGLLSIMHSSIMQFMIANIIANAILFLAMLLLNFKK